MTDELDLGLRDRLSALAAAVPIDLPGGLSVVTPRLRPGRTGRRIALGGVAPVVGIVVIGTIAAGLAKLGPFAPGSTAFANGPVEATTVDGPFELTIRSAKAQYGTAEPIEIEATLTYRGPSTSIEISHAQGAPYRAGSIGGPFGFGIEEPAVGDLVLGPSWHQSCERSTLVAGAPLSAAFAKSAAFSGSNPRADEYQAFLADTVLRLADGVWHPYAVAEFSLGDCGGEQHQLRVGIAIDVVAALPTPLPSVTAELPTGASTAPPDGPAIGIATDGPYKLEIQTDRRVYHESNAIDIAAAFIYDGKEPMTISTAGGNPLGFGTVEPVFGIDMSPTWRLSCVPMELAPGSRLEQAFAKSGGFSASDPDAELKRAFLEDPILRLPAGTWHIYVITNIHEGDCDSPDNGPSLQAEIEIQVLPDP